MSDKCELRSGMIDSCERNAEYTDQKNIIKVSIVANNQDFLSPQNLESSGLNFAGARLLYKYIKDYSVESDEFINKAREVFLSKFPHEQNEVANLSLFPVPFQALTDSYDDDWYYIDRMDDVETIKPRLSVFD